jgi:hypothetical protein
LPDREGNILIWAHDDTVEPGRMYKYRIRVIVKSPVYQTNVTKPEALAQVLELPEKPKWSEWSKPVNIPANLKLQLAGTVMGKEQVKFNVIRWQNGKNNRSPSPFTAGPGDMVGGVVGEVDYTTGWTVVDVRQVGNDTRVILVNDSGRTEVRSLRADLVSPEFREAPEVDPNKPPAVGMAR